MPVGQVHYEIHAKPTKGKWRFLGAVEDREVAEKQANDLVSTGHSVRVTKETMNPEDGSFTSNRIFHAGDKDFEINTGKAEANESLPCFKPQDLYSFHARRTIGVLLQDSLNNWRVTPLELLHSAKNLERLESSGTVLQAAIQKMAIAQSHAGEGSVAERVKTLNKLVSDGMKTVYIDHDKKNIPVVADASIKSLAGALALNQRRDYLFNSAITNYIQDLPDWDTKLDNLLGLMKDLPDDPNLNQFCLTCIDGFVSEIMAASSAIKDIVGPQPDLGGALQRLAELFCGKLHADVPRTAGVNMLNAVFAMGELPESRTAIARRILKELEGRIPLTAGPLDVEVKALRRLGTQMTIGCGNLIPHEEILSAFQIKSERLLSNTTLDIFLSDAKNSVERAERVLFLGENIVGAGNRHKLTKLLRAIIADASFSDFFMNKSEPIAQRLRMLTALQDKLFLAEIDDDHKQELCDRLDGLCTALMETNRVLPKLCDGHTNPMAKCIALLKFIASGMVTRGDAREQTQRLARGFLREPGALQNYLTTPRGGDMLEKMKELSKLLSDAGIDPDTVLNPGVSRSA